MGYFDKNNVEVFGRQDASDALVSYKTVVLFQNISESRNRLTQAMIDRHGRNTKFVVKWNYVLDEDIVMPEGCLLEFDGGSIANEEGKDYTITGNETILIYHQDIDDVLKGVCLLEAWVFKGGFSGDYNDLKNKPTIPAAQIQSDWNQTDDSEPDYIKGKPDIPSATQVGNELPGTGTDGEMFFYTPVGGNAIPVWWYDGGWVKADGSPVLPEQTNDENE